MFKIEASSAPLGQPAVASVPGAPARPVARSAAKPAAKSAPRPVRPSARPVAVAAGDDSWQEF
ncbi:hypothetical protein J7357_17205 [Xanthomonas sp. D-109]|nr:hypothetical protein [Xanthomonas sp. D-109]